MSPILANVYRRLWDPEAASAEFSSQWTEPADIFSVLLILGGDVVARAIAQLAGPVVMPVAFSFGWVAYAVTALMSAMGENKLMPDADTACIVINSRSGYARENRSWIIGRLVRDFDSWMDPAVRTRLEQMIDQRWKQLKAEAEKRQSGSGCNVERPLKAGLCVSIYRAEAARPGCAAWDGPYLTGLVTPFVQLGIAAVPLGLDGDWAVLLITFLGTALALATGLLPQWAREKWSCRTRSTKTVVLTRGNGSQHAIVIMGDGLGLDLEDLSQGGTDVVYRASYWTRLLVGVLATLWIALLVTAAGIKQNTRYLVAVGGIGILQNIYAAGARRNPRAFGVPLRFEAVIGDPKGMKALFEVERRWPRLGRSMVDINFPGRLKEDERLLWEELEHRAEAEERRREEYNGSG